MELYVWLALGVFLVAGTIKGAIGIGLPTTVISILSQFDDPRVAITLGVMPMLTSNLWQFYSEGRILETMRRYWVFAVSVAVTLFLASLFVVGVPAAVMMLVTGSGIALFAATSLIKAPPKLNPAYDRHAQLGGGVAAGLLGGFTGLWSPPLVIYLLAKRLERDDYVRTFGFLLLVGAVPLLLGYLSNGLMTSHLFALSLLMCVPTFAGFWVGKRVRQRMDTSRYQKAVLVFFLLMGLNLVRKAWFG